MKYLSRELRDEIADVLIIEHNAWVRYRDKQEPHPSRGIHIKRGVADSRIRRLRELIAILAAAPGCADDALIVAFLEGAKWWEWKKEGATMWQSDQHEAEREAQRRANNKTLGRIRHIA